MNSLELEIAQTPSVKDEWPRNKIPPITHPMGKHWRQPDLRNVLIDDTHVILHQSQLDQLSDYTRSEPSGVYEGKCWKTESFRIVNARTLQAERTGTWYLHWFGYSEKPNMVSHHVRKVLIA